MHLLFCSSFSHVEKKKKKKGFELSRQLHRNTAAVKREHKCRSEIRHSASAAAFLLLIEQVKDLLMFGNTDANNTSLTEQQQTSVLGVTPGVCIAVLGYTKVVSGSERSYEVCPHLGLSRSGDPAANPRAYGRTASSAMTC